MGIIGLSDPTGHFEAVIFSEGLAEHRDLLEPGTAVLLFLSAEVQGDEVRARIQSAEPLDSAAANLQKGLRVFLRDGGPLEAVAKRLEPVSQAGPVRSAQGNVRPAHANGDGEVSVVLLLKRGAEVEVKLPGRFKVSPQIAGAIKAVPGVVQVEAL
jgi:DNA polymerase-3 subunit alpha